MKIAITGAGGFGGAQLVGQLVEASHHVIALGIAKDEIPEGARVVVGDITYVASGRGR